MHPSSYKNMSDFAATLPAGPLFIADIGSFDVNGTYKPLFEKPGWVYQGLDIVPGKNVDVVLKADEDWTNVPEGKYDVVISGQTLEHVRRPWRFVSNMARIAKPGGLVYVVVPFRCEYHAHPIDCWRIYPEAMKTLLEDAGLAVLKVFMADTDTFGLGRKPHP